MQTRFHWLKSVLGCSHLACIGLLTLAACEKPFSSDFLAGHNIDPDNITTVSVDHLFTAVQVNSYRQFSGSLSRLVSLWMQQMASTDRAFPNYDEYIFNENDFDNEFENWYIGGGLIDIRRIIARSTEAGNRIYAGYGKFYEAWFMGTCASIWGDIPYSEAVNDLFPTPKLDEQVEVYAAVQNLMDEAIADLSSGIGQSPGAIDLAYHGNTLKMIAAAHTLKARFYLHWAEADHSNYQGALLEADQGIHSIADNMMSLHNATLVGEWNIWHQFYNMRDTYIRAGRFMVDLMQTRRDPRLTIYYKPLADGTVHGAYPAEPIFSTASELGAAFRSANSPFPLITYEENELVKAECNYRLNNETAALQNLNNVRAAVVTKWNVEFPVLDNLSGQALLDEILTEKYISLFLQIEVWNDYKRNCFPRLTPYQGKQIPGRLLYSDDERNANPNIPPPSQQPLRNANDPAACQ